MLGVAIGRRYVLVRLLGEGGMGSVYEAEDRETRARVAVKVLHSSLLEPSGDGLRRFQREAEATRALHGAHVARVLDAGSDEATGNVYLVTEHLDGEDLQRLLDREGPLVPDAALRIASQVLAGLREAHAAGVVHRDVKPANLFLARDASGGVTVKILDFGIAKVRVDPLGSTRTAGLTTTGALLGSPLYMSPEQVQSSKDVDHRTDLWSLGSVLYAALAGRAPHQHHASLGQLLVAVCTTPAPRLADVAPWVPAEIAEVVHRALEIRPDARHRDAAEMFAAIARHVRSTDLHEEMLVSCGEQARDVVASTIPPSPPFGHDGGRPPIPPGPASTPSVVPASDRARVEDPIHRFDRSPISDLAGATTLPSGEPPAAARSAVPAAAQKAGGRYVTVDPRRLLGEKSELWTFSLDVHQHASSLIARVWKALRRAGASVPPMTYGTAWVLVDARTGKSITDVGAGLERLSLEAAGIRPGAVLWVMEPGRDSDSPVG